MSGRDRPSARLPERVDEIARGSAPERHRPPTAACEDGGPVALGARVDVIARPSGHEWQGVDEIARLPDCPSGREPHRHPPGHFLRTSELVRFIVCSLE